MIVNGDAIIKVYRKNHAENIMEPHKKICLMPYENYKGADQPGHMASLISAFVVCRLDSIKSIVAISKILMQ